MTIQESGQMYLETILILKQQKGYVRSIDVSEYMNYSKPSVSRAMSILRKAEYITINKDGTIQLTETGLALATKIYERHNILTAFLESLGIDSQHASEDACKMEHDLSDVTFNRIKEIVNEK